jgi:hypothetical protein
MSRETALLTVNRLQSQMTSLARGIVTALADKKVSPWEGMQLGMQAMQLGTYAMALLQGLDSETKAELLYVLEHGQWMLPPEDAVANTVSGLR